MEEQVKYSRVVLANDVNAREKQQRNADMVNESERRPDGKDGIPHEQQVIEWKHLRHEDAHPPQHVKLWLYVQR